MRVTRTSTGTDSGAAMATRPARRAEPDAVRELTLGGLPCLLLVPAQALAGAPLLVSVHGISRNAHEHMDSLAAAARRHGFCVLAPLFSETQFPGYQRLRGEEASAARADIALLGALDLLAWEIPASTQRVYLNGFSGGAQFAHRFAMVHPGRVAGLSLAAAGWYTMPDAARRFPYGTQDLPAPAGQVDLRMLLRVPIQVLVGELDTERDAGLNCSPRIDREQGAQRVERAVRWVCAWRRVARQYNGLSGPARVRMLPGCGHNFEDCVRVGGLAEQVITHYLDTIERHASRSAGDEHRLLLRPP